VAQLDALQEQLGTIPVLNARVVNNSFQY
jgi:hypothetical protein